MVYQYGFGLSDRRQATFTQHTVSSVAGSIASICFSAPLDVIKTRIQNQSFGSTQGGMSVFKELMQHEGPSALWKGLTPKVTRTHAHSMARTHTLATESDYVFAASHVV